MEVSSSYSFVKYSTNYIKVNSIYNVPQKIEKYNIIITRTLVKDYPSKHLLAQSQQKSVKKV